MKLTKKIYIDFGGKGIPLDLPIINIKSFTPLQKEERRKRKRRKKKKHYSFR